MSKSFVFTLNGNPTTIPFLPGETVLDALRKNGYQVNSPCNGNGTCGKCRVERHGETVLACETPAVEDLMVTGHADFLVESWALNASKHRMINQNTPYAVAIDIGTTGISYALVDLNALLVIGELHSTNRQTQYGGDVFTRIAHSLVSTTHAEALKNCIATQLSEEIHDLITGFPKEMLRHIVVSANTTMCYLLLGLSTKGISRYPYTPKTLVFHDHPLTLKGLEGVSTSIIPCASAFIGGDIVSGLSTLPQNRPHTTLFMDIGTNGELVLLHGDKKYATSTAAGPALEGMNISCGSRAVEGAIESFTLKDAETPQYKTIGNVPAKSICGSGLLEVIAVLLENGQLKESGLLPQKQFTLAEGVVLTQKDIRQVQLAKGAILSGVEILLKVAGITADAIETLYVAGNFGSHLSEAVLKSVGFVPETFCGEICYLGNTSLKGAVQWLGKISEPPDLDIVELAQYDDFQATFVNALKFPKVRS